MKKILSIIMLCTSMVGTAQVQNIIDQSLLHQWFDLVEYDSLARGVDTNSAPSNWARQTQDYFFWDNSKIQTWKEISPSGWSYTGVGYWKDSLIESIMVDSSNPRDTFDTERLYIDGEGRDSAYAYIVYAYSVFEDRMITVLDYDSNNQVEGRIHIYESWYDNFVADTAGIERWFYDANGKLDSVISTDKDGVRYPGGYYFEKNSQGRVSKVFTIGPVNANGGVLDTVKIEEAIFKDSLVNEIRYYNYDHRFGKDSIWFGGVLRFAKRSNSTIGLSNAAAPSFELFPNPVKEYFVLTLEEAMPVAGDLVILDVSGREHKVPVISFDSALKVDCRTLKSGVYLGTYKTPYGELLTFRFVK